MTDVLLPRNIKVRSFKFPKREKMEALKDQWVQECGSPPIGNVKGSEWASAAKDVQVRVGKALLY